MSSCRAKGLKHTIFFSFLSISTTDESPPLPSSSMKLLTFSTVYYSSVMMTRCSFDILENFQIQHSHTEVNLFQRYSGTVRADKGHHAERNAFTTSIYLWKWRWRVALKLQRYTLMMMVMIEIIIIDCKIRFNPYPTAFPYGNGMVLHFYQQQESRTTKTVHKVINKGLKTYV